MAHLLGNFHEVRKGNYAKDDDGEPTGCVRSHYEGHLSCHPIDTTCPAQLDTLLRRSVGVASCHVHADVADSDDGEGHGVEHFLMGEKELNEAN